MATLTPHENHLGKPEPRWFAVYTRYKREKLILRHLQEKDIEVYLPLQTLIRRYTRKVRKVEIPLISCYIFTRITASEYVSVLETPDVVGFVKFANKMIAIPEKEIQLLKRIVDGGDEVEAEPWAFQVGDAVEIIGGSLTGVQGILVVHKNKKNFLVELSNIGYSLRMDVDPALLRKIRKKEVYHQAGQTWN